MSFEAIVLFTVWWCKVLQHTEDRNLVLQSGKISLDVQAKNIEALKEEMLAIREKWDILLSEASLVANQMEIEPTFSKEHGKRTHRKGVFF